MSFKERGGQALNRRGSRFGGGGGKGRRGRIRTVVARTAGRPLLRVSSVTAIHEGRPRAMRGDRARLLTPLV